MGALGVGSESVLERVAFPADNRVPHACDPVARAGPLPVVVAFNLVKLFGCKSIQSNVTSNLGSGHFS